MLPFNPLTAECWTGPDDSKYDQDGASEDCVGFGMDKCKKDDELCAGKAGTNFVYFIDVPEHTKSAEEAKKEIEELKKKEEERKKKAEEAKKKKAAAKKLKKSTQIILCSLFFLQQIYLYLKHCEIRAPYSYSS